MSVLDVVVWPAKVLETRALEVTVFDDELKRFVSDMYDTMRAAAGIGLAANQVGQLRRVITIEISYHNNRYEGSPAEEYEDAPPEEAKQWWHDKKLTFINPVITKKQGKFKFQEGCLSFPEVFEFVDRAAEVWVTAQDETGKTFEVHGTGLFAVCLQHEIDHIDGIVFFNRMSRLKAGRVKKKMLREAMPAKIGE